jgi:hypothetical protein
LFPSGSDSRKSIESRGSQGAAIPLLTMVAGAFLSYCIEFMRIYIPTRDSGWEDVFTNAAEALVGYFVFELAGKSILNSVCNIENRFELFLTLRRALARPSLFFDLVYPVRSIAGEISAIELDPRFTIGDWE